MLFFILDTWIGTIYVIKQLTCTVSIRSHEKICNMGQYYADMGAQCLQNRNVAKPHIPEKHTFTLFEL